MIGGPIRLLEMGGAISADRNQFLCQATLPFRTYALQSFPHRIHNRNRLVLAGRLCQLAHQPMRLLILYVHAHGLYRGFTPFCH